MNKKILIIGASGLVGSRFVDLVKDNYEILSPGESELNILDLEKLNQFVSENYVKSVVNFAAYTNVDEAQKQKDDKDSLVWQLNVEAVGNLAKVCKERDIFLIQFSTDFVFKGDEIDPGPFSEDKELPNDNNGIGWYGWTKNRAELEIKNSGVRNAIVRIAYPFHSGSFQGKLDFANGFLKLFDENKLYPVFIDQTLSVLNVDDLVEPLTKIINDEIEGVFHIVSSDTTLPYDFAEYLLEKSRGAKNILQKGSMKEFLSKEGRTPRPRLGGLKTELTEEKLGMKFKNWREMIDEFVV